MISCDNIKNPTDVPQRNRCNAKLGFSGGWYLILGESLHNGEVMGRREKVEG
jgi:hypothetical protein